MPIYQNITEFFWEPSLKGFKNWSENDLNGAFFEIFKSFKWGRAREVIEVEVIDAEVIEAVVIEGGSYRGRRLLREEVIEGGGYRGRKLLREEFIEVEFIEGGSY